VQGPGANNELQWEEILPFLEMNPNSLLLQHGGKWNKSMKEHLSLSALSKHFKKHLFC